MTLDELQERWYGYGVEIGDRVVPFRDFYALCYPYQDGLLFDVGGPQGADTHYYQIDGEMLVTSDPADPSDKSVIGKLVEVPPEFPESTIVELTHDYFEKGEILAKKGLFGIVVAVSYWGRLFEVKFPEITLSLPRGYLDESPRES